MDCDLLDQQLRLVSLISRVAGTCPVMDYEEQNAKKLPAFGIKDLYGPSNPPGILHISAPQYDSTIRSYPEAVMTYLDDDDGETITVGSGHELQQRLEEPIRQRGIRRTITSSLAPYTCYKNSFIHLFDIQRTADSLVVWKEHEAYSSKSLREYNATGVSKSSPADVIQYTNPDSFDYPELPVQQAEPLPQTEATQPEAPSNDTSLSQAPANVSPPTQTASAYVSAQPAEDPLRDFVEKNVDSFANFLDTAAELLRTVAQKTREADASPVESILAGMKDVLTEVGQLGLEVLNGLNYEPVPAGKIEDSATQSDVSVTSSQTKSEVSASSKPEPTLTKRVSFADLVATPAEASVKTTGDDSDRKLSLLKLLQSETPSNTNVQPPNSSTKPDAVPASKPITQEPLPSIVDSTGRYRQPSKEKTNPLPYMSFPNRPGPPLPTLMPMPLAPSTSIMDLETSNPEFAARYPPLMSLRRAKTVSELQKSKPEGQEHANTKAALHRYPSIGQLEAIRAQRELRQKKPYDVHHKRRGQATTARQQELVRDEKDSGTVDHPYHIRKLPRSLYKSPSVEDENLDQPSFEYQRNDDFVKKSVDKPLPGAWPETKQEDMSALPISNESSGAFFNRMAGIKEPVDVPARPVSPALSCRNTSPPADPFWPAGGLRRAHTVTASNPAARLTRPFDPMINAPKPLFPRTNDQPTSSGPPKRSLTQRQSYGNPPKPMSTIGGPTLWSNFPRPAQVPMNHPQKPAPVPHVQAPLHHPLWTAPSDPQMNMAQPISTAFQMSPMTPLSTPYTHVALPNHLQQAAKVADCVRTLRSMGYGMGAPNEMARLNVYAGASGGNVIEAVDMIEEDRQAAKSMTQESGVTNIRVM